MPLLKPDAPPIPPEEVAALRARLALPYDHEVVTHEDKRYLFLRAGGDVPDPVADLEAGFEAVPAWTLRGLSDVFLLGRRSDLHVPGHIARPVYDMRLRLDGEIAREARTLCDVHYGVRLHRTAADPRNVERLLVRVPHERCADVTEADLVELARAVGPLHDAGKLVDVRACHLVAEADHVRFRAHAFLTDLLERWAAIREHEVAEEARRRTEAEAAERAAAERAAAEALEAERMARLLAPPPPRRVEDVTPALELEAEANAAPPHTVAHDALAGAEAHLADALAADAYTVARAPYLPESPFVLEARRATRWPRRVALLLRSRFDREHADEAIHLARAQAIDLLLVLTASPSDAALRRVATTRVRVLTPEDAAAWRP
jgi:hypothetical protein